MTTIRTLIADDEPLALTRVRRLLADAPDIEVVAECEDGAATLTRIVEQRPELAFLDVQMPELDAFQVLEALDPAEAPVIVFVTAFSEFALRAFDAHALDYLLKPFDDDRFAESLDRARAAVRRRRWPLSAATTAAASAGPDGTRRPHATRPNARSRTSSSSAPRR